MQLTLLQVEGWLFEFASWLFHNHCSTCIHLVCLLTYWHRGKSVDDSPFFLCELCVGTRLFYTAAYKCAVVCWYYLAACVAVGAQVLTWCLSDTPIPTFDSCTCDSRCVQMTTAVLSHIGFPTWALNGFTKAIPAWKQKRFCFPAIQNTPFIPLRQNHWVMCSL